MADRITNDRLVWALDGYVGALNKMGYDAEIEYLRVGQPYGMTWHVWRVDPDRIGQPIHDLPGFFGSSLGYTSKRDIYDAIRMATRTLYQFHDATRVAA